MSAFEDRIRETLARNPDIFKQPRTVQDFVTLGGGSAQPQVEQPTVAQPEPSALETAVKLLSQVTPDEQPKTGTDTLNEAATTGTTQAKNEWQIAQEARDNWVKNHDLQTAQRDQNLLNAPVLSTGALPYAQDLIQFKQMYTAADNPDFQKRMGMTADQIREYAGNEANRIRAIAQAAGYDLSGYDSDVSLDRAIDNLSSNNARAREDILHGKYSQTTDQFYEQRYRDLRLQGHSMSNARKLAGDDALQYQMDKMAYLSDMLGGYGRSGGYLNELGTQIVGRMVLENSDLGNYMAKNYGTPKDAQDRENTIEDTIRSHIFGQENSLLQAQINDLLNANQHRRGLEKIGFQGRVNLGNTLMTTGFNSDLTTAREREKDARAQQQQQAKLRQAIGTLQQMRAEGLITNEQFAIGVAGAYGIHGIPTSSKGTAQSKDTTLADIKAYAEFLQKKRDGLTKQLQVMGLPDDERKQINAQIQALDEEIATATNSYSEKLYGSPAGKDFAPSDDEAKNLEAIRQIVAANPNATPEQKMNAIRSWGKGLSEQQLAALIEKAFGGGSSGKTLGGRR